MTDAVSKTGVFVLGPLEIAHGSQYVLRRRSTQRLFLLWLERGIIGFVHLGTPCTIWSQARHDVKDSAATRAKEETGLELALFSCEVIRVCQKAGIPFSLENPRGSKLFQFEPLLRALFTGDCYFIDFDMCMYGEPYRKSTRLATSCADLFALARKCVHHTHDVRLKGQVKVDSNVDKPRYVNRTASAGAYPSCFCRAFAGLICRHVRPIDQHQAEAVAVHWESALRSVAQYKARRQRPPQTKISSGSIGDFAPTCELLEAAGGLHTYFDCIQLGRNPKDAWKAFQSCR